MAHTGTIKRPQTDRRALDDVPGVSERAPQNARGSADRSIPECRTRTVLRYCRPYWRPGRTLLPALTEERIVPDFASRWPPATPPITAIAEDAALESTSTARPTRTRLVAWRPLASPLWCSARCSRSCSSSSRPLGSSCRCERHTRLGIGRMMSRHDSGRPRGIGNRVGLSRRAVRAVAITPPTSYDDEPHEVAVHRIESQSDADGDQRLAG